MNKKIAVITGASSGMGREFAVQIAAEGGVDELWVIARRRERLEALKRELEHGDLVVRPMILDLTSEESVEQMKTVLAQEQPNVQILVNASGFGKYGTYRDLTDQEITQMIDLNCKSVVKMTYAVLPYI